MWLFRRNKFKRLNREDLVNSICELERQERTVEAEVLQKIKEIDALMAVCFSSLRCAIFFA